MDNSIEVNGFVWEADDKGDWIFKSEKSKFKKEDGTLKKKYADMPRYDLIPKYEQHFVKEFEKELVNTSKELIREMKKIINK